MATSPHVNVDPSAYGHARDYRSAKRAMMQQALEGGRTGSMPAALEAAELLAASHRWSMRAGRTEAERDAHRHAERMAMAAYGALVADTDTATDTILAMMVASSEADEH